jgi:hypothetical protein
MTDRPASFHSSQMAPQAEFLPFDAGLDADIWHHRVFQGEIALFGSSAAMGRVAAFARAFVEDALTQTDPTEIHRHHPPDRLAELLEGVQRDYIQSAEAKASWANFFAEIGIDGSQTARDRLVLRFQPPATQAEMAKYRSTATVGFHRDSWATNLYAQVNWWAPVFPITADRTFGLYPSLWDRALPNDSATFDMPQLMQRLRDGRDRVELSELIPSLTAELPPSQCVPVVIEPGEIIAFSAQHAHCGIPNRTGRTRISLDTRTIRLSDYTAGRGAPNVDGRALWAAPGMFRQIDGRQPFHEMIGAESRFIRYQSDHGE